MSKIRVLHDAKSRLVRRDIEFSFKDVQTRNPKTVGKTPLYLFTKDPLTRDMIPKKRWWEK